MGSWYIFFVVDRAWLHGKYIRWRWQGAYTHTFTTSLQIWDGEFVRSSMVDFPDGSGPITKGNGILQTLDSNVGTFAAETVDVQADTSGGSEEKCTVIFRCGDAWSGQQGYYQLDWIEINTGAAGSGTISDEQFTDSIIAEQAGTRNDYGYIGYGRADPITHDLAAGFYVPLIVKRNLSAEFISRQAGTQELPAEFIVRQPGSQELPGELIVRQLTAEELLGEFAARRDGSQELGASFDAQVSLNLPAEFVARRDGSQELGASFDGQVSLNLPAEFIVRQPGSQNLASGFNVNYWYYLSHLVITAGMISGGTLDDTRQKVGDGNDLDLGEVGGAPGFDYEFHFLNAPADEIFGIRMLGFYDGNAAHVVKLYEWNFTLAQWDAVTNAASDILDAVVDQTYVWMAGGPDYIQGGEYRLRMLHPAAGNPVHESHWDYIWLDEDFAESEDSPPAHFTVRQTGSANLLGGFIVRHPGSQELGASFDGQVSLNLPSEFSSRRSTQQELAAEFIVNQSSRDLPGAFVSRQPGSQSLPCKINIIAFLTLPASFTVQNNVTFEIPGAFSIRRDADEELSAEFIVRPDLLGDLLAEFSVLHGPPQLEPVIIAENPAIWINVITNVGTGFLSTPVISADYIDKVAGSDSLRTEITYQADRYDYIKFGWRTGAPPFPAAYAYFDTSGGIWYSIDDPEGWGGWFWYRE